MSGNEWIQKGIGLSDPLFGSARWVGLVTSVRSLEISTQIAQIFSVF